MTFIRRGLAATLVVLAASAAIGLPAGAGDDRPLGASLAEVRRATAKYHDPAVALADGFVATDACAAHPQLGGMGLHYVHPARLQDPAVTATEPEVLLYERGPDGRLRLTGVEWWAADPDQDLSTDDGRPELFDVAFDGPMPGHEPGMPIHFDLHAWVWKHNPAGTFAPWNPTVHCG